MKFSIKDFLGKCDQIRSFLRIWWHLLKKSLMKSLLRWVCYVVCPPKSLYLCYIKLISLDDTTDHKNLHYLHRNFKLIHESFVSHRWASLFGKINKNMSDLIGGFATFEFYQLLPHRDFLQFIISLLLAIWFLKSCTKLHYFLLVFFWEK